MSIFQKMQNLYKHLKPLQYAKKNGMKVGKGVTVAGNFGTSFGTEPYLITLDDYVRISGGAKFFTHDGGTYAFRDIEKYKGVQKFGCIHVGERTFVGYGAMIMPGVNIGKRCVIAAGAVVTKDVPDYSVVGGVPAKYICSTFEYADKCMKQSNLIGYNSESLGRDKKGYLCRLFELNQLHSENDEETNSQIKK